VAVLLLALLQIEAPTPEASRLSAGPEKAFLRSAEKSAFRVSSPTAGPASWRLLEDLRLKPLAEGVLDLVPGKAARVEASLDRPGFLVLEVRQGAASALAAAAVEPGAICPAAAEPSDFDAFWDAQRKALRAAPPGGKPVSVRGRAEQWVFDTVDGRRAYAWILKPEGKGPFPVVLEIPAFGSGALEPPAEFPGAIQAVVSVHSSPLDAPAKDPYRPEHAEDPARNYFKGSLLGVLRVLDHLLLLPGVDPARVVLTGKSQGGGLAIMAAALDARVTHLAVVAPAFGQHAGTRSGRSSGFPSWVWHRDKDGRREEADRVLRAAEYYETAHFAKRFKGRVHGMAAWIDAVCPPSSVMPAFNAFPGPKEIVHGPDQDHDWNRPGRNWWPLRHAAIQGWLGK
jgi:cephalosporin-C deacetylase-like acetyl esterase